MKSNEVGALVSNRRTALYEPYPDTLQYYFMFHPPGYMFMPHYRRGGWDGYIRLLKRGTVPTGVFYALRDQIEKELGIEFDVVRSFKKIKLLDDGIKSDRPYQNDCVEAMVRASHKYGGGIVLNATGSGKTFIAAMYFSRLVGNACFLVDELTLLEQARKEISKGLGEEVGMIGDSVFDPQRITVATSQTLDLHCKSKQYRSWVNSLQVIVIDEIHQAMSRRNFKVVEAIEPPVVFGLTATLQMKQEPVRLRAWALAGPTIYEYPLSQGQEEGYLAPSVAIQITYTGYQGESEGSFADYHEEYLHFIVEDPERNNLIAEMVKEGRRRGKYVTVLVERIRHLKHLSEALDGIPHRVVSGQKRVDKRLSSISSFEKGKVRVVLANKVFKKGINLKRLDCIIDGAAMKNKNDAQQKHGRGVRQCNGKAGLLYFDIGDFGNRFEKAATRRRRALKALGIPFQRISYTDSEGEVGKIYDRAEKVLARRISALNQGTQKNLFE